MTDIEDNHIQEELFDNRYKLLRPLSTEGGTADVWLAEDTQTLDTALSEDDEVINIDGSGVNVAIKIYRQKNLLDLDGLQTFKKEFKTIYNCHHSNLIKPTGYGICGEIPYLVMPYCKQGSVEKLIGKFTDSAEIWKFIHDVASGLAYLHACNPQIIHQDIMPANILIDDNNYYCITDFGISVNSNEEETNDDENSGTIIYMPPERFEELYKPNPKSDIWSFGATLYELITGDVPFGDEGGGRQLKEKTVPEIAADIPKRIKKLIYSCLDANPEKRPTAKAIAEIARNHGKKHIVLNVMILIVLMIGVLAFIVWNRTNMSEQLTPFEKLCNSGDSIINIEKANATYDAPIDTSASLGNLNKVLDFYQQALQEDDEESGLRDSVINRMNAIREMVGLYDRYKVICDSLQMAKDDGAYIREAKVKNMRDSMSNKIKQTIKAL